MVAVIYISVIICQLFMQTQGCVSLDATLEIIS